MIHLPFLVGSVDMRVHFLACDPLQVAKGALRDALDVGCIQVFPQGLLSQQARLAADVTGVMTCST